MAKPNLLYGTTYRIQNGFGGWGENYLDTRGTGCEGNLLCVSTSTSFNRHLNSGSWIISSAKKKAKDDPVLSGDQVYLQNQYSSGAGGYLDTRGKECEGNYLCVSTSTSFDRDSGSGIWRIIKDDEGGDVREDDVVHLWNGWREWFGGFLDTRGKGCDGNLYCVSTCGTWNRVEGSTHWRFQKQ